MANMSTHQIAEVLVGIARAQQAIVEAVESMRPGFRSTHLFPAIMNAARVRDTQRALQLADLPARVLLQCMGRNGPDIDKVAHEIDEIVERQQRASTSLDMTQL